MSPGTQSQVLARRYRPQTFEDVIGQDAIVRTLRNALLSGRIAHGFIFSGHRGIGKTTVARILAKALNCQSSSGPTATPCGECDACREIREGNAVDVIEIDAASNRGIEEIRALRERVRYRPARDRYKMFILDEAHQLTDDAFNALLKTLEEPPEWVVFVLATTEPEALPATIRSRCQHYSFRAVPYAQILDHLRKICTAEGIPAEEDGLGLLAEAGEGSVRDALSLLDQAISHALTLPGDGITAEGVRTLLGRVDTAQLRELLGAVRENSPRRVLELTGALLATGVQPASLVRQLSLLVRNALVAQSAGATSDLLEMTEAERAAAATCAGWFREEELARFLQILLRTAGDLRFAQQERLHLELGLIKMVHARNLSSIEDVLAALQPAMGTRSAGTPPAGGIPEKPAPVASAPPPPPAPSPRSAAAAPPTAPPAPLKSPAPMTAPPTSPPRPTPKSARREEPVGDAEARAEQNPLLKHLRERIPTHVLRTRVLQD